VKPVYWRFRKLVESSNLTRSASESLSPRDDGEEQQNWRGDDARVLRMMREET
jgi:hypothetical protein